MSRKSPAVRFTASIVNLTQRTSAAAMPDSVPVAMLQGAIVPRSVAVGCAYAAAAKVIALATPKRARLTLFIQTSLRWGTHTGTAAV